MTERALLCYSTRYGSTEEVAKEMAKTLEGLGVSVDLIDLRKERPASPLDGYQLIVIGSGIMAGKWTNDSLNFIKENLDSLSQNRVALFVVCGYAASADKCDTAQREYLDKMSEMYPGLNPISTGLFPGVFDFKKYNFMVRALVKRIMKAELGGNKEVPERVDFRDWNMMREWITKLVQ